MSTYILVNACIHALAFFGPCSYHAVPVRVELLMSGGDVARIGIFFLRKYKENIAIFMRGWYFFFPRATIYHVLFYPAESFVDLPFLWCEVSVAASNMMPPTRILSSSVFEYNAVHSVLLHAPFFEECMRLLRFAVYLYLICNSYCKSEIEKTFRKLESRFCVFILRISVPWRRFSLHGFLSTSFSFTRWYTL